MEDEKGAVDEIQRQIDERREIILEHADSLGQGEEMMEWAIEDEIKDDWQWLEDTASDDLSRLEHDFADLQPRNRTEWDNDTWAERRHDFQRYFNFLFIGLPWLFIDALFQFYNILISAFDMNFWSGGNLLLVFYTFVSLF